MADRLLAMIHRRDRILDAPSCGDDQLFLYMEDTNRSPEREMKKLISTCSVH
jgi:hypothetical protein